MQTTPSQIDSLIESLDLALSCSDPVGKSDNDWARIEFQCTLKRGDRIVWQGPYSLGVGFVNLNGPTPKRADIPDDERAMLDAMRRKPLASFTDKRLQAAACARLAKFQGVKPKLADVLHGLLSDSSPYFAGHSFADWCGEWGHESDNLKAKSTYESCMETGRQLTRAFTHQELESLLLAFSDY